MCESEVYQYQNALGFIGSMASLAVSVLAQDVQTKGTIGGHVFGCYRRLPCPGAKIVVSGQTGERTGTTNQNGIFKFDTLNFLGTYTVRVL